MRLKEVEEVKFTAIIVGSTNDSTIQEMFFVRYCPPGKLKTRFLKTQSSPKDNAKNVCTQLVNRNYQSGLQRFTLRDSP